MNEQPKLQFRKDGSFRVLHLTDIQEGLHPRKDTMHLLNALLAETMPDLVILTGDQLKGYSPFYRLAGEKGVRNTIRTLLTPMENYGIPYAVTFGNHDAQCGLTNEEQAAIYRQNPHCICPEEGPAAGTFCLSVQRRDGQEALRFYLLDSGNVRENGSYAPPSDEVLTWLKDRLFDEDGVPSAVPSVVFQHIPLIEYKECKDVTVKEPICSPDVNTGEFELLWSNGNVMGVFCGHDHKNDFVGRLDGIDLGYTPSCGFACYGPGVDRGGRLLVFHTGSTITYETKLIRYRDVVAPHTGNRLKEYWDSHIPTCWPGKAESRAEEM